MLDALKNLKYYGGKEGLLFFICNVVGNSKMRVEDAAVICAHAFGKRYLSAEDLVNYCLAFGWIEMKINTILISSKLLPLLSDEDALNDKLITDTVTQLFTDEIMDATMFSYDSIKCCYAFKNELLPLSLSSVRNTLISQGFIVTQRDSESIQFYISPKYDSLIAQNCIEKREKLSLKILKEKIKADEIAGEKAELFVLNFEKERIGQPLCEKIKRISEIDVTAGYDIVSFNSFQSRIPDRFIEVKAVSKIGFYWSKKEYDIAKLKGENYYLYLVELGKIGEPGYSPEMINNPAENIGHSEEWLLEPQSYYVVRV